MVMTVTGKPLTEINLMPGSETEEITQNIRTIVTTELGTAPMCRDIGVSGEAMHRKSNVAKVLLTRDTFTAMQDQEERACLMSVRFEETDKPEQLMPVMEVEVNGG